jgi:hypothetical protein
MRARPLFALIVLLAAVLPVALPTGLSAAVVVHLAMHHHEGHHHAVHHHAGHDHRHRWDAAAEPDLPATLPSPSLLPTLTPTVLPTALLSPPPTALATRTAASEIERWGHPPPAIHLHCSLLL